MPNNTMKDVTKNKRRTAFFAIFCFQFSSHGNPESINIGRSFNDLSIGASMTSFLLRKIVIHCHTTRSNKSIKSPFVWLRKRNLFCIFDHMNNAEITATKSGKYVALVDIGQANA